MARRKRGIDIHGWMNVDKPAGMTSAHVVNKVKRLTNAKKVGHGGTLDPMATGVLPLALGEATKTVSYAMDGAKAYRFTITFGEATTTDDAEGEVIETNSARPSKDAVIKALDNFVGEIEQIPPKYSAIKIDGERAYDLAREGEVFEIKSRIVEIDDLVLADMPDEDHAVIECVCGKGTYMRALARDIAVAVGTVGHVSALRRIAVGPFDETDAISLDKLESLGHIPPDSEVLLPVETALDDIPALALTEPEARRMAQGQPVAALPVANRSPFKDIVPGDVVRAMSGARLVALAVLQGGEIRPFRVLNL